MERSGVELCRSCEVMEPLILVVDGFRGQALNRCRGSHANRDVPLNS